MKKILIVIAAFILLGISIKADADYNVIIPSASLRLRVIPNSNNPSDQMIKEQVKTSIQTEISNLLVDAKTVDESIDILENNIDIIDQKLAKFLNSHNLDYEIKLGSNYFPRKVYKGVLYEEGYYDSLVIIIGDGEGDNWWCVLFPPLCLLEVKEDVTDVEYQLFITNIINYFK